MRSALLLAGRPGRAGDRNATAATADGTEAVRRAADRVATAADELVVTCPPGRRPEVDGALDGLDPRLAADPVPDEGPVAGMRTGLRVATGDAVAVVACDGSRPDPDLLDRLFATPGAAAVPRAGGRLHPLHAVYDAAAAREACERTLAAGSRRLYDVLSRLETTVVDADPDAQLADVDTPGSAPATLDGLGG
jgi:molybdopterin-guanine dinucleotide biosynthesis protein A